jgi:hypothetical protein
LIMPQRPTPIIVPGPGGLSLDRSNIQTTANIDLGAILALAELSRAPQRRAEEAEALAGLFAPTFQQPTPSIEDVLGDTAAAGVGIPAGLEGQPQPTEAFPQLQRLAEVGAQSPESLAALRNLTFAQAGGELAAGRPGAGAKDLQLEVRTRLKGKGIEPALASPEDITTIIGELREEGIEEVSAEAEARVLTEFQIRDEVLPIPPEVAINTIDPDTFRPVAPGTTPKQARDAGAVTVTKAQKDKLAGLETSGLLINQMDSLSQQLITAEAPTDIISAARFGKDVLKLKAGAFFRTNPIARAYIDALESFLGVLSRSIGGERGVMTDRDIGRIRDAAPGFGDTQESRDLKMLLMRNMFLVAQNAEREKILGRDFNPKVKQALKQATNAFESGSSAQIRKALENVQRLTGAQEFGIGEVAPTAQFSEMTDEELNRELGQ